MNEILDLKALTSILRFQGIIPCNILVCGDEMEGLHIPEKIVKYLKRFEHIHSPY